MAKKRGYGGGGLILRGKCWYIKYSYKGVQVMRSAETEDKATADAKLDDVLRLMQQGAKPFVLDKVTIGDLVALVLADYELHRKKSADIVRDRAKKHVIPAFGRVKVRNFGTIHLTEYIAKRRAAGAADATINRELAIVRRGFSLGEQNQPPMVLRKVYIPALAEDNTREGFIDRSQYKRLCTALPERLRCLFGSEVCGALATARRAIGMELKPSYYRQAVKNGDHTLANNSWHTSTDQSEMFSEESIEEEIEEE